MADDASTTATTTDAQAATTEGQQAATTAVPAAPTTQVQAPTQAQATAQQATNANAAEGSTNVDMTGWPQSAIDAFSRQQKTVQDLRKENGDKRMNAKASAARAALRTFAEAAGIEVPGLEDEDAALTPEQLAAQVAPLTTERDEARKEAATVRAAVAAGVPPQMLDYLQFKLGRDADYQGLTQTDPEFSTKLAAFIGTQMSTDATLRPTGSVAASGVESLGGASGNDTITPEQFRNMSVAEKTTLYRTDKPLYDRLQAAQ